MCLALATLETVGGRSTGGARRNGARRGISTSTASGRKDTRNRPARSSLLRPAEGSASCPGPGRTPAGILKRTPPSHGSWVSLRAADRRRCDTIPTSQGSQPRPPLSSDFSFDDSLTREIIELLLLVKVLFFVNIALKADNVHETKISPLYYYC